MKIAKPLQKAIGLLFAAGLSLVFLHACYRGAVRQGDTLVFSHKLHGTGEKMQCSACHTANASQSVSDRIMPVKKVCAECHDVTADCKTCHTDPARPSAPAQPPTELVFSHGLHMEIDGNCEICHKGVGESTESRSRHMPAMDDCLKCHDGKQASDRCARCHSNLKSLRPKDHDAFWKGAHGIPARARQASCYECHEQASCSACHEGRLDTANHPRDFRHTHGVEALNNSRECGVCHTKQYCKRCHG